jgi:hypothetical protein
MINYKVNSQFKKNLGFEVSHNEILLAVSSVNTFLCTLPPNLYSNIDFKTTGAMIGAIFCAKIVEFVPDTVVNPIEKGHPDIIPVSGLGSSEAVLRNYPKGMEIKGTIGNLKKGSNLRAGVTRINELTGITWQAHHREVNYLLGIIWDFVNDIEGFNYPAITGVFFSDELNSDDWGEISGTTGRNTKVTGMLKSGKEKMGQGVIILYDSKPHIKKYTKLLNIPSFD